MPSIPGYTPPVLNATHYNQSTLKRVDETELRLELVREAFEGLTLVKGDKGEAFKVDIFGTVAQILAKKNTMTPSPNDVFYAVITDDTINLGRALFEGIETTTKLDLSRHSIMFDGTTWYDFGEFTGTQGPAGNDADATAAIATLQSTEIDPVKTRVSTLESDMSAAQIGISALETTVDTATTGLSAKVSALEGTVNASTTGVSAVAGRVSALETTVDTATTGLSAKVSALEGTVNTATTGLISKVSTLEGTVNASVTGVSAVAGRVSALETTVDTATTGLTAKVSALETTVNTATTGLISKVSALETTVNASNTGVADVAGRVSALETTVDTATTGLTSKVTALETTVDTATTGLTSKVAALEGTVNASVTGVSAVAGRVSALETTVDTATTGLTSKVTALESTVNTATTGLTAKVTALEGTVNASNTGVSAVAGRVSDLETTVDTATTGLSAKVSALEGTVNASVTGVSAVAGRVSALETTVDTATTGLTSKVTALEQNSSNYLLVEGESDTGNQVLWACGAAAPIVARFGIPVPYKAILYRSSGISYGTHGDLTKMTVDVNNYGLTGSATLLKTLEFNLVSGGFMTFKEASAKSLANLMANGGNFLSLGNVIGYNASNEVIAVPANLRFRITLEVFKDEQDSGFSLAL